MRYRATVFLSVFPFVLPIQPAEMNLSSLKDWNTLNARPDSNRLISQYRADDLVARLPKDDPWIRVPDASTLAWGESATLQALVNLYEATGEVRYLKELARRGDRMLLHRDDKRGVADGSGNSRPAWSMGSKYAVASGKLQGSSGVTVIELRSTTSAQNQLTKVEVRPEESGKRFSLYVSNQHYKRTEIFSSLSMDPKDERFVEKIVNDPMSPYSARGGEFTEKSNLVRVRVVHTVLNPVTQSIYLKPIPLAYAGYLGIIYTPLLRFAEIVRKTPELKDLSPEADRFIKAAQESYEDASKRLWRNGPGKDEGYYLTCEKGESFPADNVGQPFNYLGKHVVAQLALYRLTGKKEYLERSERMCRLFKNRLTYQSDQDLYVWNYWYEPMTTTGWTRADNISFNVNYFKPAPNIEDTSHGVLDIEMVTAANKQKLVFTESDVKRFANTLLKNVLLPDRSGVRRKVDGAGDSYPPYFTALHGWLELSQADANVYHAIREAYTKKAQDNLLFCSNLLKWERLIARKGN